MLDKRLEKLKKLIEDAYQDLDKMSDALQKLDVDIKKELVKETPGVEGTFDGKYLVTKEGEKLEVPANYAAKSRLVYGDILKAYEEDGKALFKQLKKVPRKKIEGIVTKKEGRWVVLTEKGSHDISSVAIDFNKVQVNDHVMVILPEVNTKAPYAALDKVLTQKENVVPIVEGSSKPEKEKKEVKKEPVKAVPVETPIPAVESKEFVMDLSKDKKEDIVLEKKKEEPKTEAPAPKNTFVLEDDDLR